MVLIKDKYSYEEVLDGCVDSLVEGCGYEYVDLVPVGTSNKYRFYNTPLELMEMKLFVRDRMYRYYCIFVPQT
jgi:hypothetical protein